MDPITLALMGAGAVAQIGGGLLGYYLSKGDRETAQRLQEEAIRRYGEASEEAINNVAVDLLPPTELAKIEADPRLRDAQMGALDSLLGISDSGGLRLQDEAVLNKLDNRLSRQENTARQRISDEMATRGIGGSGTELALLQDAAQDRLQRRSEANLDIAGKAQERALEAIMSRGEMAGRIRGQEFSEKSRAAEAQDAINRFNAGAVNANRQWQGQARLGVAENTLGARTRQTDQRLKDAQDLRQTVGGVGQGVGQGFQTWATYGQQQKTPPGNAKAAVEPKQPGPYANAYVAPKDEDEDFDPWANGGAY